MSSSAADSPAPDPTRRGGAGPEGRADRTDEYTISVGDVLDHDAPEPPPGTVVETSTGQQWKRLLEVPATYSWWQWVMTDGVFDYPHTRWQWALVAEKGPVTVVKVPGPFGSGTAVFRPPANDDPRSPFLTRQRRVTVDGQTRIEFWNFETGLWCTATEDV